MRNATNSRVVSRKGRQTLLVCLLIAGACQASPSDHPDDSTVSNFPITSFEITLEDLVALGLTREEALGACGSQSVGTYCRKNLASLSTSQTSLKAVSPTPDPNAQFDSQLITKKLKEEFEDFRLGQNDLYWHYSEPCRSNPELVNAKMENLRSYLTDLGLPPYNLHLEVLSVVETAPGEAQATTELRYLGEALFTPETRTAKYAETRWRDQSHWSWRLSDCDLRELDAGSRCGKAFGALRYMCVPLWEHTSINENNCDLKNPIFYRQLHNLLTTTDAFSLTKPEDLTPICNIQESHPFTSLATSNDSASLLSPFTVAASIIKSFDAFRLGKDDPWTTYAKPCRTEQWDAESKTWTTRPDYFRAETANLRAYLNNRDIQPSDLQMEVLEVTEVAPGRVEATTRIRHLGEPISNPGTQSLQYEDGIWKTLNCDKRELKAGWLCGEAFGEHRGACVPLWADFVRDQECEKNNPDFFGRLYQVLATSRNFYKNPGTILKKVCGSKPNYGNP